MSLPTYFTGTASVAVGGTVVTGTGCIWSGINAKQGDWIALNGLPPTLITEVTDSTHLKIPPWVGAAQSNVPYIIYQSYGGRIVGMAAAEDVGTMLERLNGQSPIYNVPEGETEPDPSYGENGQWAYSITLNKWWLKTGGVWVVSGTGPSGSIGEAPPDSVLYGRKNTAGAGAWQRAVAAAGDTMAGQLNFQGYSHWYGEVSGSYYSNATVDRFFAGTESGTDIWRIYTSSAGNALTVNGATGAVNLSGALTAAGKIISTAKENQLGNAGGTIATGALVPGDANIKLYGDFGGGNWAGIGSDGSGQMWFRTGLSGTASAAMYLDTNRHMHIAGDLYFGGQIFAKYTAGYNIIYNGTGENALLAGGSGDPANYYRNTNHYFQAIAGGTSWLQINATDARFTVPVRGALKSPPNFAGYGTNDWDAAFQATAPSSMAFMEDQSGGGPAGAWWFNVNMRHQNGGGYWGMQQAWGWEDNANEFYTRNWSGGVKTPWVRWLNQNNFGTYALPKTGGTITGNLTVTGNISAANYYHATENINDANLALAAGLYNGNPMANGPLGSGHWYIETHAYQDPNYIKQMAWQLADVSQMYTRQRSGGAWGAWQRVMLGNNNLVEVTNAATARSNIGAQANLGYTPVNRAGDQMTGVLTSVAQTSANVSSGGGGVTFEVQSAGGLDAVMTFHRTGAFACYFGLASDHNFWYGGWSFGATAYRIWSTRNCASQPVTNSRLAHLGDAQYGAYVMNEPYSGGVVTGISGIAAGSTIAIRWRQLQVLGGETGVWYACGYA